MTKQDKRRRSFYRFLLPITAIYMRMKVGYEAGERRSYPAPFLVIANHVTDCDQFIVSLGFEQYLTYVIGEHTFRSGWVSKLLQAIANPIPRPKATTAFSTVREMLKRLKKGECICLFAEGTRSHNGLLNPIASGTGHLVRKLGCPVITYRIEGGYFTQPRWAKFGRKGWISGHVVNIYTPEQMRNMSGEDLEAAIARDIGEDAYAENAKRRIAYRGKKLAEGLERELVLCPQCRKLQSIQTKDDRFFCDCGLSGTYDVYGLLHGEGFSFQTVTEWDLWQQEQLYQWPDYAEETLLCEDDEQVLTEILAGHQMMERSRGKLRLTTERLWVGDWQIPLSDLAAVDLFRHGYLLLNTKQGQYLEIKGKRSFSGYLYVTLINRYRKGK